MKKIYSRFFLQKITLAPFWCFLLLTSGGVTYNAFGSTRPAHYNVLSNHKDQGEVSGKVTDIFGKPLVDVTVQVKSKPSFVKTDLDGWYNIKAEQGDVLVFNIPGYNVVESTVGTDHVMNITLAESNIVADRYNVLYGRQKKSTNVASVSEVYTDDLRKTIVSPINGTFAGRFAGLFTSQSTGEPGSDAVSLSLRGQSPLVVLDGIPQSFSSINPEQIESVTVLKDALATAMLGIRGANGAILITTKKGQEGAQRISFTGFTGIARPTEMPKSLDAYNYALLYNEALQNDGKAPVYSQNDLDLYRNGNDPIGHPNVNWRDEILKKHTAYSRYNFDIAGGRQVARYYVNLDYLDQDGLFKTSPENTYNTNSNYKRYIVRSNVQVDLNKSITTSLNLMGRIQEYNEPGVTATTLYNNIIYTPANAYPIFNSNGSLGASQDFQMNIYGQNYKSGYQQGYTRDFRVDLAIKGKLDEVTPGLWVKASAAINTYLVQTTNRSKSQVVFQQSTNSAGDTVYTQYGSTVDQVNSLSTNTQNRVFYTEAALGYSRDFEKNSWNALLLANNDYRMADGDLAYNIRGISGKGSYSYDQKYIAEVAFAYNGSPERYPKDHHYGFFPSIGLGWNISRENFIGNKIKWLNNLKLRASYGRTGNFNPGYYTYNQYYNSSTGYSFGTSGTGGSVSGIAQGTLANSTLTWEKANKLNIGLDGSLFSNKLDITTEYFNNKYYDLLQTIGRNTAVTGATYGDRNIGVNRYSGWEFQFSYRDHKGAVNYFISPNISLVKSKVVFQDEVTRPYAYQQRTGLPVGQQFGYVALGLFQSADEINQSAKPANLNIVPGDIKYADLNNDNVIDENDQAAIGTQKPFVFYGLNFGASWKGLDFSALLQGAENRKILLSGYSWSFQGVHGQAFENSLNRWTPSNTTTASYPRLTVGTNPNNDRISSYWIRPADYLRLKSIEIGYTFPVSLVKKVKLAGTRIFINGSNLLTFSDLKDMDPENYMNLYPIQKMVVAGINVKF